MTFNDLRSLYDDSKYFSVVSFENTTPSLLTIPWLSRLYKTLRLLASYPKYIHNL